jgi:maltose alpha-D-glucosyltransferase/alpha-amylase
MAQHISAVDEKLHWYKDAIIYELHIKAFRDSNRDGIGDFKGLMEKLDYLQELGVTAIWVLPFYPSPLKDDGYDIADYYSINPRYGTLEQFREFLEEAHKRNLKVITELVINHTSDQHPWFARARTSPKGSPEREFYVWTDDPNRYKDVRIIFQDFEASNWTWDPLAQQYYWHRFFHHQPDLNYDNPLVQDEIFRIIDYWCALGVDGFRLDAVPYLYEREHTNGENLPETHAFLKRLRKHIDEHFPGVAFLAEANMWPEDSASYFGNGDECHMNYHFPLMPRMFMSVQQEDRYPITDIFDQTPSIPETCQWAIFLRNHDELTLEMVTDEERDFMYKVYAKDPKARINLGIRHRLAPLMDNNRNRIELMNSLLFSLPGTPVIYYGDEIGMGDNFYLGDRDGVRTPMQWSPDRNAGFSETNPQQLYLPVILDPEYHYEAVNVEMQRRNTSSLFWFMKRMISMRRNYKAFSRGSMKFISVENPKILAFSRTYEDETLLVIANLSKYAQPAEIDLRAFKGFLPVEIFSKNPFPVIREDAPYLFTLGAYSFQWFVLQKLQAKKDEIGKMPNMVLEKWDEVFHAGTKKQLEDLVLPPYLNKRKWFKGKNRTIFGTTIQKMVNIPLPSQPAYLLVIEVTYESGLPETYQMVLAAADGEEAQRVSTGNPEAVMAQMRLNGREALLCDGYYLSEMHQWLIGKMAAGMGFTSGDDTIEFKTENDVRDHLKENKSPLAKMHTGDENNTSINYDNRLFLKMYRKVDKSINPDVELSYYLSEVAGFAHVPRFLGTIELLTDKEPLVLGMMQVMIENHGDGHSYMLERLHNYVERIQARSLETLNPSDRRGSINDPVAFEDLPGELQVLLGNRAAEQARLIGKRTAEMHLALAGAMQKDFKPEEYSLHYQRSLFSSMQSLVRESYQTLDKQLRYLPEVVQKEARSIVAGKEALLQELRRIYTRKLDIWKIRIHGSYILKKLLMTGRDVVIQDFGGNPFRSFSERRIRRSPIRDLADMVISFYYTAYEGFFTNDHIGKDEADEFLPFAEMWAHYMSGFFVKAYLESVKDMSLVPRDKNDFEVVMKTFLLEKTLAYLNFELNSRSSTRIISLLILRSMMGIGASERAEFYK